MRAISPDQTVEATLTPIDGVSVTCRPGTLRYHSAASFARQVELSLAGLACDNDRAAGMCREVNAGSVHAPRDIAVEAVSPRGLVRIRLRGSTGYRVQVARTFGLFGESAVTEEVNTALHSVNERFAARSVALAATPLQRVLLGDPA